MFLVVYVTHIFTELWTSDGTTAGTQPIVVQAAQPILQVAQPSSFVLPVSVDNALFYAAGFYRSGIFIGGIGVTDGTTHGTRVLVKDLASVPEDLEDIGGTIFFEVRSEGVTEAWKMDATAGAVLIRAVEEP